jgi:hypothetical protein
VTLLAAVASHVLVAQPAAAVCPEIVFDFKVPDTVFVGYSDFGTYKSTDNGRTWRRSGLRPYPLSDLKVDPQNPQIMYAGTWDGVMKSTDGGATWRSSGLSDSNVDAITINPRRPSLLFARASMNAADGWPGAVFKSVNGGIDWKSANEGLPIRGVLILRSSPDDPGVVYAGTSSGVFKTDNAGESWSSSSVGLPAGRVKALVIDGQNAAVLYVAVSGSSRVYRSSNAGRTWTDAGVGLPGSEVEDLSQRPAGPHLWAATGDGVYTSTDGGATWRTAGLRGTRLCRVAASPRNPQSVFAATGWSGSTSVFKTVDGGVEWSEINEGLPEIFSVH